MRQRKIRGHKNIQRKIEYWRLENISFDLNSYLEDNNYCYARIRIYPWNGCTYFDRQVPEPKRKTRQKFISALIDIYNSWKEQLEKLDQPYYLRIRLFNQRFSKSDVICAIGNKIEHYENSYSESNELESLNLDNFGHLKFRLEKFNWDYRIDEDYYDNCTLGTVDEYASIQSYNESKTWFNKLLKSPHRTVEFDNPIDERTECYLFKRGDIWLGELKD